MYTKRTIQILKRNQRASKTSACMHSVCVQSFCARSAMYIYHARVNKFCYNQCVIPQCCTISLKHIFYRHYHRLSLYHVHYCHSRHNISLNITSARRLDKRVWELNNHIHIALTSALSRCARPQSGAAYFVPLGSRAAR
jgi:hypothetical protein